MRNQPLRAARSATVRDVVHRFAALQAQEFHLAKRNSVRIETVLNDALTRVEAKAMQTAVSLTTAWMQGK